MTGTDALLPFRFFDPAEEHSVIERELPHWAQAGTLCFLTWRTWDSMPRQVIQSWLAERDEWLARHGIDPKADGWRDRVNGLPTAEQRDFHRKLSARWESCLDECHGACLLRRPELAQVVANSLKHFDGDRYVLSDFVVMPNHVHVLAAFPDAAQMLKQCASWKHYTAVRINRAVGRSGRFWEVDGFDHLVRGPEQFEGLRDYVAANPRRANLRPGEFIHYSRDKFV
jgi:REP element-mobilizing transposase RayT